MVYDVHQFRIFHGFGRFLDIPGTVWGQVGQLVIETRILPHAGEFNQRLDGRCDRGSNVRPAEGTVVDDIERGGVSPEGTLP